MHYGSQLLAFPCSLPLLLTKEQREYIFLCLCHNSFISGLLKKKRGKKKVIWFSLSIFKETSNSKTSCNTSDHSAPALARLVQPLTLAPRHLSLCLCLCLFLCLCLSLSAPSIFTGPDSVGLGPQEATQTLGYTVLQNLAVTYRSASPTFIPAFMKEPRGQGQ